MRTVLNSPAVPVDRVVLDHFILVFPCAAGEGHKLLRHLATKSQGNVAFASFPPCTSTRFIIEPISAQPPRPSAAVVTCQTPSGTRGKEKQSAEP